MKRLFFIFISLILLASCVDQNGKRKSPESLTTEALIIKNELKATTVNEDIQGTYEGEIEDSPVKLVIDANGIVEFSKLDTNDKCTERLAINSDKELFLTDTSNNQLLRIEIESILGITKLTLYGPDDYPYYLDKK